jgi:hypothetical protein
MPRSPNPTAHWIRYPTSWREMKDRLDKEWPRFESAKPTALGPKPKEGETFRFLQEQEALCDERIRQAIRLFAAELEWPHLEEPTRYFLRARISAARNFLNLCLSDAPFHPLKRPHEHCSDRDVLEWLLIDYWQWVRFLWFHALSDMWREEV